MARTDIRGADIDRVEGGVPDIIDITEVDLQLMLQFLGEVVQRILVILQVHLEIFEQSLNSSLSKKILRKFDERLYLQTWVDKMKCALMVCIQLAEQGGQGSHECLEGLHLLDILLCKEDAPLGVGTVLVQGVSFSEPGIQQGVDHLQITPPINTQSYSIKHRLDNYLFTNELAHTWPVSLDIQKPSAWPWCWTCDTLLQISWPFVTPTQTPKLEPDQNGQPRDEPGYNRGSGLARQLSIYDYTL